MVARCFLNGDSLATVLHLEMLVGAGDKQGALNPVTISFLKNDVEDVLCPD